MRDWEGFVRERLDLPRMKGQRDERMIRELADHLEDVHREALVRGYPPDEAEWLVERALGEATETARELASSEPGRVRARLGRWTEGREERLRARGGRWSAFASALGDLRVAARSLSRHPLFSGVAVLVLAIGIGATTSIFALVDAVVLSPLGVARYSRGEGA